MSLRNKKVLLTYGPTWVPIDGVRVISNVSTGELGRALIAELRKKRARLTVLEGPVQQPVRSSPATVRKFKYFQELYDLVKAELAKKPDVFIHAAAVSDYRVKQPRRSKLPSDMPAPKLILTPTPKIIRLVKPASPETFLVGFKLESSGGQGRLKKKALELARKNRCDLVVANTLQPDGRYEASIFDPAARVLARAHSRPLIARKLVDLMDQKL